MEAQVLEQHHAARAGGIDRRLRLARRRSRRRTAPAGAEQLRQPLGDRPSENSGLGSPFGRPRCDAQDHRRARVEQVLDRRQRRADARVVGDRAVLDRHVEVDAHEHALARDVELGAACDATPYRPFFSRNGSRSTQRLE